MTNWWCEVKAVGWVRKHPLSEVRYVLSNVHTCVWPRIVWAAIHSNQQAVPITVYKSIYYISHIDEFTTELLHTGDDKKVKRLLYTTVHYLMMGQWGPKHVAVDVLQHYCNSNELCAFVGLQCGNFPIFLFRTDSSCPPRLEIHHSRFKSLSPWV